MQLALQLTPAVHECSHYPTSSASSSFWQYLSPCSSLPKSLHHQSGTQTIIEPLQQSIQCTLPRVECKYYCLSNSNLNNSIFGYLFQIMLLNDSFWFWVAPRMHHSIKEGSQSLSKNLLHEGASGNVVLCWGEGSPLASACLNLH